MKKSFLFVFLFVSNLAFSQDKISNEKVIRYFDSFLKIELKGKYVRNHDTLNRASQIHSDWMLKTGILDHYENDVPEHKTPRKRVYSVSGNMAVMCREVICKVPITPKKFMNKKFKSIEEETAFELLSAFKDSPDHNYILTKGTVFGYGSSNDGKMLFFAVLVT